MASLRIGDPGCSYYEILDLFDEPSISSAIVDQWTTLARKLDTPPSRVEKLRRDLLVDKITYPDMTQVLLEDWVMRNGTKASLGKLFDIIPDSFRKLKDLLQVKIKNKAKCWIDLDNASQKEVLQKKVLFMGTDQTLSSLGDMMGTDILESVLQKNVTRDVLEKFFKEESVDLGKNPLNQILPYYVNRTLTLKRRLNPAIFMEKCDDIFVIEGIEHHQLSILARPESTDVSSNQVGKVTCRFIHLEDEDDYKEITRIAQHPVHKFKYHENDFIWLSTFGSRLLVTVYLSNHTENIPEEHFINEYLSTFNSRPISICSSSGMGKSVLLAKLANSMRKSYPERIVIFLEFQRLIKNLASIKSKIELKFAREIIASHTLQDNLGVDILINLLSNPGINFEIFLDGFDEIPMDYLEVTKSFLSCLIKSHNMRTYITSRPHMRDELELITEVISFDIAPLQKKDQVKFLCNSWTKGETTVCHQKHQQFALMVLESLEKIDSDSESNDFAGIPLQCYMLAEVYAKDARRHANLEDFNFNFTRCLYDLYEKFMEFKFHVDSQETNLTKVLHYREALDTLFPGNKIVEGISEILNHLPNKPENWQIPGVIEPRNPHERPTFVHKSFAEYLLAEFIVKHLSLDGLLAPNANRKFIYETILATKEISRETEIAQYIKKLLTEIETSSGWKQINQVFVSPLFLTSIRFPTQQVYKDLLTMLPPVLEQKHKVTSAIANFKRFLQDSESGKHNTNLRQIVGTGKFVLQYPNICFFLNAAIPKHVKKPAVDIPCIRLSMKYTLPKKFQQKLLTCTQHGFKQLTQMLTKACIEHSTTKGVLDLSPQSYRNLIDGAARNDDLELFKYCCHIVEQLCLKNSFYVSLSGNRVISFTFGYSHFYEAVLRGNYKLTEYLINQFGNRVNCIPNLWKFCLQSSSQTPANTIRNKKRILKLLKHLVQNQNIINLDEILPDEIAVELFIAFCDIWDYVPCEKDVSFMSTHLTRRFTQDIEMDMIVHWLISKKLTFLLLHKCVGGHSMLCDALFLNVLSPETLSKIFNAQTFNLGDILHETILCKRGEAMIETIVELSGDVNMTDANKNTPLHWAAFYRKINSIRYLLTVGADVNCTEFLGNTPLHMVLLDTTMPFNSQLVQDCVQLILHHNPDVLARNRYRKTPAELCEVTSTTTVIHRETVSLLKRKQFINNTIKIWGSVLELYAKLYLFFPSSTCGWLSEKQFQTSMNFLNKI